ncbi:hypothetical protein C9E82_12010 [Paracoccus siganidrum]|nr:hypothetical protein C9E82_12010 [Paracoccus siganidrum]
MMGISFASGFLYAFAFGCIFVLVFAWQRFRQKAEVVSASRALTHLSPSDLGGRNALIRAYLIYAGSILLLYVSLTFFGQLMLQSMNMTQVAGIEIDVNQLDFDSPQWPLLLAFAVAGISQMLPPVATIEGWLRDRAYRAAGIPVRLELTMRNLIVTLEQVSSGQTGAGSKLQERLLIYRKQWEEAIAGHDWAREAARQRPPRHAELISLLAQLELLVFWARTARGNWPGHEVSQQVRAEEENFVKEAEALLNDFRHRLSEKPPKEDEPDTPTRKQRFNDHVSEVIETARNLRFDLVGILAIFLERDVNSPDLDDPNERAKNDPSLYQLLERTERPDSAGTGPETGLFFAAIAVFVIYATAIWRDVHDPINLYIERDNLHGVLASALVETLTLAALTWLPLLAAFSLRQYLWDTTGDWAKAHRSQHPNSYVSQILVCMCLGLTASLIGLVGVAMLHAFFVAQNGVHFSSLLVQGNSPFLLYYPTQAIVVFALVPLCILSADLRERAAMRLWYGVFCALAVGFLSMRHTYFFDPTLTTPQHCPGLAVIGNSDCAGRFDLVGHLLLMVLAFLAAGVFGDLPERTRAMLSKLPTHAATTAVLLALMPLSGAWAQEGAQEGDGTPTIVTIGFRDDTPPFSFRDDDPASLRPFSGYLADLCFDIFAGSTQYQVKVVPVTAKDRFERLRLPDQPRAQESAAGNGEPEGTVADTAAGTGQTGETPRRAAQSEPIDILCDAVTMRFSDQERSRNGIYSPIVFASGVSFLETQTRSMGGVTIGFVQNTTAREVARKLCEIDYFKIMLPSQKTALFERCHLRWREAVVRERLLRIGYEPPDPKDGAGSGQGDASNGNATSGTVRGAGENTAGWLIEEEDKISLKDELTLLIAAATRLTEAVSAEQRVKLSQDLQNRMTWLTDKDATQLDCILSTPISKECHAALARFKDPVCELRPAEQRETDPFEQRPWPDYHFCPMPSHDDLVSWFCATPNDRHRVYMGDRELILAKRAAWVKANGPCRVARPDGAEYLSYEPYAFLISMQDPRLVQFVQHRIHQLFSERARMTSRFAASFPGHQMSPALAYLFLLNGVENEQDFTPSLPAADSTSQAGGG